MYTTSKNVSPTSKVLQLTSLHLSRWKQIWKTMLPPKVICFSWKTLIEACLTQDNISRRSIHIVNRCYTRQQSIETSRHLLLHCTIGVDI